MTAPVAATVTPVHAAGLLVEGERMPIHVHLIERPGARVLVEPDSQRPHMDSWRTAVHRLITGNGSCGRVPRREYSRRSGCRVSAVVC